MAHQSLCVPLPLPSLRLEVRSMSRQDLQWLLSFAKSNNLMGKTLIEVLPLFNAALEDYYKDMEADYWIDMNKAGLV